jgi:disulfide bond formation protein DsbB
MGERLIKILSLAMIMLSTFIFTYILMVNLDNKPIASHSYIIFFILLVLLFDGITLHSISSGKFKETNNLHSLKSSILGTLIAPVLISSLVYLIVSIYYANKWDIIGPAFYRAFVITFSICIVLQVYFFFRSYLESKKTESG